MLTSIKDIVSFSMIKITVLYNLPPSSNKREYIQWRLTEHQKKNASIPGVIRSDFSRAEESWPEGSTPKYRYRTNIYWPDYESFANAQQ